MPYCTCLNYGLVETLELNQCPLVSQSFVTHYTSGNSNYCDDLIDKLRTLLFTQSQLNKRIVNKNTHSDLLFFFYNSHVYFICMSRTLCTM